MMNQEIIERLGIIMKEYEIIRCEQLETHKIQLQIYTFTSSLISVIV